MSENHDSHDHTKTYMNIWGALFVLTILEVGAAVYMTGVIMVLSLVGMASLKAFLVARYYMHLKFEPSPLSLIAAAPIVFLGIMSVFVAIESNSMPVVSIHTTEGKEAVTQLLAQGGQPTVPAEVSGENSGEPTQSE